MIVAPSDVAGRRPGSIYGGGIAEFLGVFLGDDPETKRFAATFGTMVFATFVFDTLDVATRLGRYVLQELTGWKGLGGAATATALTAGVPLAILLGTSGSTYEAFWVLFGTSNQLLAALTLLAVTIWLKRTGRRYAFTAAPMAFVLAITLWALVSQGIGFFGKVLDPATGRVVPGMLANGVVTVLLFALAAFLVREALGALRRPLPLLLPTR
jgi:carbon starvation protein